MHSPDARPPVKDVARSAGVSTATVSRVINATGNVSREVRSRVLAVIAALDYSPNVLAAQLSRNGGQPRKRAPRSLQPSVDLEPPGAIREPHTKRARESLKLENRELRRVIKNLVREVIRWKKRANAA